MNDDTIVCRFTHNGERYQFPGRIVSTRPAWLRPYHVVLRCLEAKDGSLWLSESRGFHYFAAPGEIDFLDGGPMSIDEVRVWE